MATNSVLMCFAYFMRLPLNSVVHCIVLLKESYMVMKMIFRNKFSEDYFFLLKKVMIVKSFLFNLEIPSESKWKMP